MSVSKHIFAKNGIPGLEVTSLISPLHRGSTELEI
jgi:hypothetical protein